MSRGRDEVEKAEVVRSNRPEDLHFRYIGTAKGRTFVVDIQFDPPHQQTGVPLQSIERSFLVAKALGLVMNRLAQRWPTYLRRRPHTYLSLYAHPKNQDWTDNDFKLRSSLVQSHNDEQYSQSASGLLMSGNAVNSRYYRGIAYRIEELRVGRWKWEITPPESVEGLYAENGEVDGGKQHATMAAYGAIDRQTSNSKGAVASPRCG